MAKSTCTILSLLLVSVLAVVAVAPDAALAASRLAAPILVSPTNNTYFQNYPRDTTLVWQP